MTIDKVIILFTVAAFLLFGVYVIKSGYDWHHPEPTERTPQEITEEYTRLLEDVNELRKELIDLYELKRLQEEGKLHSS